MSAWLRGFALLVALIAIPFFIEKAMHGHRRVYGSYFDTAWNGLLTYWPTAAVIAAGIVFVVFLTGILFDSRTAEISQYLTVAENELNSLLRSWGGGLSATARKDLAKERAEWLSMVHPWSVKRDLFFDLNQQDLEGGGQAAPGKKARMTAFLLREIYQGRIKAAQSKIIAETKNDKDGNPPYVAPGLRELLGMDEFERTGNFPSVGISKAKLIMAIKRYRHPRNIYMVETDSNGNRIEVKGWDVIEGLTRQKV
jgi:hypothetical protein